MKNRLNQAVLIFAIAIVLVWNYMRYTNNKKIEKYEMDKSEIMQHLTSETELDSILVMTAAAKLTDDEGVIQKAYKMADDGKREELTELFKSL
jgi:hypothetical protein